MRAVRWYPPYRFALTAFGLGWGGFVAGYLLARYYLDRRNP